ncbi:hypothetical protein [Aureibacillus halotolerans]|uniref:Uncharacterized protein n=1 Tax=Aureibacillus halotolerans TaxID=1508390 RepID=A0A4R6U3X6_9BACI|nr:hypothetical protein [Aureibacillus halotolerans]TDQ39219.1 hypothetical protein EV213_108171 [Aureibacillus halotolerans]
MRECRNCGDELPPETEHYAIDDKKYCTDCIKVYPKGEVYFIDEEFLGDDDSVEHVESYDDEYEEDEMK